MKENNRIGFSHKWFNRLWEHIAHFSYIWILLFTLLLIAWLVVPNYWHLSIRIIVIVLGIIIALLLIRPMNAVYGLMGTAGSIPLFFFNFIFITLLFAGIYHLAFFKEAAISYDINQPHIDFKYFSHERNNTIMLSQTTQGHRTIEKRDTIFVERQLDTISFKESIISVSTEIINYQKISFWQIWRSTILTTLTQEPADLLSAASVHNAGMESTDVVMDKQKSALFEWVLIFHIIISWIFFGVFISLLYNKFRYES